MGKWRRNYARKIENYGEVFKALGVFTRIYGRDIWSIYIYIFFF